MKINQYVRTLKGVTNKSDVLGALDSVQQDLTTKLQPIADTCAVAFKLIKLRSPEMKDYEDRYRSALNVGRGSSIFGDIQTRLQQVARNINFLRGTIERTVPETIAASNVDYRTASLMQLVDNAAFMVRFLRRFAETACVYELEERKIYEDYKNRHLTKGEAEWIKNHFGNFLTVFETFSSDTKVFSSNFDKIPNIKVDLESDHDLAMFGHDKVDPFHMGFIPVSLNPFFHIGKWVAEFQVMRYKEAQEDLGRIQKRILLLEEADAGRANPKVEKEIEILRNKSESLIYKINKAEEDM